jgi:hypothetical protein
MRWFFGATRGSILVIRHMSDSIVKVIIPLFVFALFAATSGVQSALAVVWRQIITWQRPAQSSLVTLSAASAAGHGDGLRDICAYATGPRFDKLD